jgi:DNA uptake protein ComE-like DNA-binding protein
MRWRPGVWVLLALGGCVLAGPSLGAASAAAGAPASAAHGTAAPSKPITPIDINSASRAQLKKLSGIGDTEAQRIIAHRPYHSKADLVTENILPAGVYQSIRHQIIAIQPAPLPSGKHP